MNYLILKNKYQSMTLAGKEVLITLHVDGQQMANAEEIKLLGIDIDKKLQFRQHISNLCKKVSRQLGVLNRLKKLIPQDAKIKLYNSFLLSHLQYCSIIWHNCLKQDTDKLELYGYKVINMRCFTF